MKVNSKNRGFVRGTLVVMADGREKPIEQIRPGDYVLSFDEFDAGAPLEPRRVLDIFNRIDSNVLEVKAGDSTLLVAKDQMFIGPNNDWKEVYNHSLVVDRSGQSTEYTVSKISKGKHQIYDITVEDNHSLIANGLRVHNAGTQGSSKGNDSSWGGTQSDVSSGGMSYNGSGTTTSGGSNGSSMGMSFNGGTARTSSMGMSYNGTTSTSTASRDGTAGPRTTTGTRTDTRTGDGGRTTAQTAGTSFSGSGDRSGLNSRGSAGYASGYSFAQTVNNGQQGRRKKNKRALRNQEPTPRPNPNSVSLKLIDSVLETAKILSELVTVLDPLSLTSSKITVQTGVDTMFSHANSFLATIFPADLSTYDKMELISAIQNIMTSTIAIRKPFEETIVSASGKSTAIAQLALVEIYAIKIQALIEKYTTKDNRGSTEVRVDDKPVAKRKKSPLTFRRGSNGTYSPIARSSGGGSSGGNGGGSGSSGGGSFGFADSPGTSTRGNTQSSAAERAAVSANNAAERTSNYVGGGGPNPSTAQSTGVQGTSANGGILV